MGARANPWWAAELERMNSELLRRVRGAGLSHVADDGERESITRRLGDASATPPYPSSWFGEKQAPMEDHAAFRGLVRKVVAARISDELRRQYRTTRREDAGVDVPVEVPMDRELFIRRLAASNASVVHSGNDPGQTTWLPYSHIEPTCETRGLPARCRPPFR